MPGRTARDLTPEELEPYRAAARRRAAAQKEALVLRERTAWALARQAADLVRQQFGATRIVVYGSLVHSGRFTPWSDVDLDAWGLRSEDTLRALGAVMDLSPEIELNLVDMGFCRPDLVSVIAVEGVEV